MAGTPGYLGLWLCGVAVGASGMAVVMASPCAPPTRRAEWRSDRDAGPNGPFPPGQAGGRTTDTTRRPSDWPRAACRPVYRVGRVPPVKAGE